MGFLRWTLVCCLLLAGPAVGQSLAERLADAGNATIDLRYRYESVDQQGKLMTAGASTIRARLTLASNDFNGWSGLLEVDDVEVIGADRYDDTRNGLTDFPLVADPAGADLNQAWLQFAFAPTTKMRLGRQRINLDNQRFVGGADWRQNEQTFDALRIESAQLPGIAVDYAFVNSVRRVYGPDNGTPPAELSGTNHLVNLRTRSLPVGTLVGYGYFLDFDEAPQLSSDTLGLRYEGKLARGESLSFGWAVEYARQRDAGRNPADIDAHYAQLELRLKGPFIEAFAGAEILSGEDGIQDPAANPAFQTPLATLHKWQGWADKFTTTPPAGIEDRYVGLIANRSIWSFQATWHDFSADANGQHYGSEIDVLIACAITKRVKAMLKIADYAADDAFTDTRKAWIQLGASF